MRFCSQCGSEVTLLIPQGDNRERFVCKSCEKIHYINPNNVAGAILTWQKKVLLCTRAIEPQYGLWTLPAGFMENNETVHQAAARESLEEANARAGKLDLFGIFSLPYISQVYMMFSGELLSDDVSPGVESLQVRLFDECEIPWDKLAFPVIKYSLELYFKHGNQSGSGRVHQATITRLPDRSVQISPE